MRRLCDVENRGSVRRRHVADVTVLSFAHATNLYMSLYRPLVYVCPVSTFPIVVKVAAVNQALKEAPADLAFIE
jgi:hypothetical protein